MATSLTQHMVNFSEETLTCIYILHHSSTLTWPLDLGYGLQKIIKDRLYISVIMLHLSIVSKTFYCPDNKITEFKMIYSKHSSNAYVILYELIDLWVLDSNRRVRVWLLPWRWHILSILLITDRGISTKTCGFDDVFPPDDLCSHPEILCIFIYAYAFFIRVPVIWRIYTYTRSVVQYWWSCAPSQSIGLFLAIAQFLCLMLLVVWFGFTNCVLLCDDKTNTRVLVTIGIRFKQHFDTRYFVFCNLSPPKMFLSLDLISEYRIQNGTIGSLYVTSRYSNRIFYRGFSGFATDCPCGVWCRRLTTCLLYIGPLFRNRLLNNSWAVGLT